MVKDQVRTGAPPGTRTPNPQIKSPLLYGSGEFGSVLTWAYEPARHPLDPRELQPELQPRARSCWTRRASHGGNRHAVVAGLQAAADWAASGERRAMREPDASSNRPAVAEECTQAGACCTTAAHPGTRLNPATVRARAGTQDVRTGVAREHGGRLPTSRRTGPARGGGTWLVAGPLPGAGEAGR
jgi:hypothetical protein